MPAMHEASRKKKKKVPPPGSLRARDLTHAARGHTTWGATTEEFMMVDTRSNGCDAELRGQCSIAPGPGFFARGPLFFFP